MTVVFYPFCEIFVPTPVSLKYFKGPEFQGLCTLLAQVKIVYTSCQLSRIFIHPISPTSFGQHILTSLCIHLSSSEVQHEHSSAFCSLKNPM